VAVKVRVEECLVERELSKAVCDESIVEYHRSTVACYFTLVSQRQKGLPWQPAQSQYGRRVSANEAVYRRATVQGYLWPGAPSRWFIR
jgi:hypothetical protein